MSVFFFFFKYEILCYFTSSALNYTQLCEAEIWLVLVLLRQNLHKKCLKF